MPTYHRHTTEVPYDPEQHAAAGRKGSARRHSPDTYIRSLVKRAPELTEDNKAALRALLASVDGGRGTDG